MSTHAFALITACTILPGVASASPSIRPLARPAGVDVVFSNAISADGTTIVGLALRSNEQFSFIWTEASGLTEIPGLGAVGNGAADVSADGSVVVGSSLTPSGVYAYRWTAAEGVTPLSPVTADSYAWATGVSDDGQFISGYGIDTALRWRVSGGVATVQTLWTSPSAGAYAISGDGTVILGASSVIGPALRWTAQGLEELPMSGQNPTGSATALNHDGSVIAGILITPDAPEAFLWTASGGSQPLGRFSGDLWSWVYAMNGDGTVLGGEGVNVDIGNHALLWTPQLGFVTLSSVLDALGVDLTGWKLGAIDGISADGLTLVGNGTFEGHYESFIARIPAPSSAALVALFGIGFARRRPAR